MNGDSESQMETPRYVRSRIGNACDGCKARKVKCDGKMPCNYCASRQRSETCHYSPQKRRTNRVSQASGTNDSLGTGNVTRAISERNHPPQQRPRSANRSETVLRTRASTGPGPGPGSNKRQRQSKSPPTRTSPTTAGSGEAAETAEDTEVQRDARLLCDAQGKLIFIGDCAPLSFFQSVRQVVTSRVNPNAFAPESSRYSVLENAPGTGTGTANRGHVQVNPQDVSGAVTRYLHATAGIVDLFDETLRDEMVYWANVAQKPRDITSTIKYLVMAIGMLMDNEEQAQQYFEQGRSQAYEDLNANLSVGTVQAFVLITMYMLCSCQINSAFLFFGISVRAAYSIGVHRTEVNARFGNVVHRQRDRLWKSLRGMDLFLSISMGRPPATSDVDCTVSYEAKDADGKEEFDLLNASVQILLITERVVVEVYSRKKISLQLTEGISHQLRTWSEKWTQQLKEVVEAPDGTYTPAVVSGACQVLSSYYYSVMLVSRPFLMYELYRRLSDRSEKASGKTKLADACIDAATMMVDLVMELVPRGVLNHRAPILVTWLFASSLVIGVGLLGRFGRILERYMRLSIRSLEEFAQADSHAKQYSFIAQSLMTTAMEFLEQRDLQERQRRTESSSQLFGLMTDSPASRVASPRVRDVLPLQHSPSVTSASTPTAAHRGSLDGIDSAFLGLTDMLSTPSDGYWSAFDDAASANLFPLLETGGGIDLAHYF